ncbi:hypothetical protein [Thermovenabulum sp.]|uniref:hypothetical protein n=1 Tax=Thermovenabulum sp. TaxID=3100335 RepID=UPI003C7E0C0B
MWRYNNFISISEDFIPVFSEEKDRVNKNNWKFFIPHDSMKNLLNKVLIALERSNNKDCKSIWLTGTYGTGKTYASFVIKHLLEDPLEEIEAYFKKYENIKDLWERFKALRENKRFLVVYRSALDVMGHINSNRRLMIELQQAIKNKLKNEGLKYLGERSIIDQLIKKLTEKDSVLNLQNIFEKYKYEYFNSFASMEQVVEKLINGDTLIAENIAKVFEHEGITVFDSPDVVKAWIKEIIELNNLGGLIFIWDEFTEYFIYNSAVTPLQELAHATGEMPFYLFLITHRSLKQFTRIDEETQKKLEDRFHSCELNMNVVTAYKLISNAIEIKDENRIEWEAKRDTLWNKVDLAVLQINLMQGSQGATIKKEELRMLTPIHPYSAYLLSTISSLFSSSQRTFFQFLKTNIIGSFQWFISKYPENDWYWLTPDYIWQYFFENDDNLKDVENINDIITHFNYNKDKLQSEEELRVFRVMMLLSIMNRKLQGTEPLFKQNLSVIKRMFMGTELYNKVEKIAEDICNKEIMHALAIGNDVEYIIPTTIMDRKKLDQLKQQASMNYEFNKMVDSKKSDAKLARKIEDLISLQGASKLRHYIKITSAKDIRSKKENILREELEPYEILTILVVALNDSDLFGLEEIALELTSKSKNCCILISQAAFGEKRYNDWINYIAHTWYYEQIKDSNNMRYFKNKVENIENEWMEDLRRNRIFAFFQGKQRELSGCDSITNFLEEIVLDIFPYCPEKISKVSTLYNTSFGKAGAEIGLNISKKIQSPYKDIVDELIKNSLWDEIKIDQNSEHPIVKMKIKVNEFFETNNNVSIKQIWEELQNPPFGLMPCPIGIVIFSLLLREYSQGYYYWDGVNSRPLNPDKLAELIENVTKNSKNSYLYSIRKISKEGENFCKIMQRIFNLTNEQSTYPEETRKQIRNVINNLKLPLWTIGYYIKDLSKVRIFKAEYLIESIRAINEILSFDKEELSDDEMKNIVELLKKCDNELSSLIKYDVLESGFREYLNIKSPKLLQIKNKLNIALSNIIERIKGFLKKEVYLWREEEVDKVLADIVNELEVIDALSILLERKMKSIEEINVYFKNEWYKSKYPLWVYKEGQDHDIIQIFDYLYKLFYVDIEYYKKENLSDKIIKYCSEIKQIINDTIKITKILVKKYSGQDLDDDGAKELYGKLQDMVNYQEYDIKDNLLKTLSLLSKQKRIIELNNLFYNITGANSPDKWAEEKRMPIYWMFDAQYFDFIEKYDKINLLPESEIIKMIDFLKQHSKEFEMLKNDNFIFQKFMEVVAKEYINILKGYERKIHEYIYGKLGSNIKIWTLNVSKVQELVIEWIKLNYKDIAYNRALKAIENMNPERMKKFVIESISNDPLLGIKLLSIFENS